MTPVYRDIANFPGYRVGDDGSVWTRWERYYPRGVRGVRYRLGASWVPMSPRRANKRGHRMVTLRRDGKDHYRWVHRLVLEAFVGPCPEGKECAHENGNPADNRLTNLRWATPAENSADKSRHGTNQIGERNPQHKLTESSAAEVILEIERGDELAVIAKRHGVHHATVWLIAKGRAWKHLPRTRTTGGMTCYCPSRV